uniref:DUF2716 domain-containing protein n=1 Tax=Bacillus sp. WP8 TaxID=756828 RepID=UPI0011A4ADE5
MENWIPLSHQERKLAWETLYRDFKFHPSISRFPSFRVPSPFITYDISAYFEDPSLLHADEGLEKKALLV